LKPNLQILPIEEDEAMVGGIIHGQLKRAGIAIGEMDPMIAATALNYALPLITGNLSHCQRIIDRGFPLEIDDWRRQVD